MDFQSISINWVWVAVAIFVHTYGDNLPELSTYQIVSDALWSCFIEWGLRLAYALCYWVFVCFYVMFKLSIYHMERDGLAPDLDGAEALTQEIMEKFYPDYSV